MGFVGLLPMAASVSAGRLALREWADVCSVAHEKGRLFKLEFEGRTCSTCSRTHHSSICCGLPASCPLVPDSLILGLLILGPLDLSPLTLRSLILGYLILCPSSVLVFILTRSSFLELKVLSQMLFYTLLVWMP